MQESNRARFWTDWILANAVAEPVGLGAVFVLASLVLPHTTPPQSPAVLLAIVVGVGVFEGVIVGAAQWLVLRRRLSRLRAHSWILATTLGATVAWILGMLPNTLFDMTAAEGGSPIPEPSLSVVLLIGAIIGAVLGCILAAAQWWVLRKHSTAAARWIPANALAWSLIMPMLFLLVSATVANGPQPGLDAFLVLLFGIGLSGALVGAIHGLVLLQILDESQ